MSTRLDDLRTKSQLYMPEGDDRSSPQFHISTRLDDQWNEGQRHMSEGDDRPSSDLDMSTRVDDMCNEEQRIYVTTVDVMLFSCKYHALGPRSQKISKIKEPVSSIKTWFSSFSEKSHNQPYYGHQFFHENH
jgi:hypothetical protein